MERKDATELLEIVVSESGRVRLLQLSGEFDMAGVDKFERLLALDQAPAAATFVLDLRGLTFIDSSGLRALIMADQRVRAEGGRVIVVRGPDRVNQVLEVTGVARQIELVDEPPTA
jgi:anti-sigma B factor antagonist